MSKSAEASRRWRENHRQEYLEARLRHYRKRREDPQFVEEHRARSRAAYRRQVETDEQAVRARARAYYEKNRDELREQNRARYQEKRSQYLLAARLRKYGLTQVEFEVLSERDKVCAICGAEPLADKLGRTLRIDHDHSTGRVRGLLCNPCNLLLHRLETRPGWLESAFSYLHRD